MRPLHNRVSSRLQGRQLIESDQEEIREAEARFLSPEEVGDFVHGTLANRLPDSMRRTSKEGRFEVRGTGELRDALQRLLREYPSAHYARTEIVRFRKRLDEQKRMAVSFSEDRDVSEFVHTRHPLVLLARHLARDAHSDIPYCSGMAPSGVVSKPTMLVWAVGSLEGYTSRAELLCAAVDCNSGSVRNIAVQQAQEWVRMLTPPPDGRSGDVDVDQLTTRAERTLLDQFALLTKAFNSRNDLLTDKARQAVDSHAARKLSWLNRQLSRDDLKRNMRNLYLGWSRNIEAETQSKMDEIEQRGQVRSSLEIVGVAVIHPN